MVPAPDGVAREPVRRYGRAVMPVTLLTFVFMTLIHGPASIVTIFAILVLSVGLDVGWSRRRERMGPPMTKESS